MLLLHLLKRFGIEIGVGKFYDLTTLFFKGEGKIDDTML
jgi:hypothetical protein